MRRGAPRCLAYKLRLWSRQSPCTAGCRVRNRTGVGRTVWREYCFLGGSMDISAFESSTTQPGWAVFPDSRTPTSRGR